MTHGRPVPKPIRPPETGVPTINYDGPALLEHPIGNTEYRLDVGKQGTALALSTRPVDTWDWAYLCELKWDGSMLKGRTLEFATLQALSVALAATLED